MDLSLAITVLGIIINTALAITSGVLGFMIRGMKDQLQKFTADITSLRAEDMLMTQKIGSVEVLLAGKYASRDDFTVLARDISDLRRDVARLEAKIFNRAPLAGKD